MEDFEIKVKEIFHLIAEYGIKNKRLDFRNPEKITEKDKKEFISQVHKGFRLGQNLIIQEIVPLLEEQKELRLKEKEAKRDKNKELVQKLNIELNLTQYKIKILRHFADFIAWQIFKGDYYKARRFFSGDRNRPDLLSSNLDSVLSAVRHFHNEDESSFGLITDLTSFIDIGDILLIKDDMIGIVECKEGKVQKKIYEFFDYADQDDFDVTKVDFSDKDSKFFDQAERTLKQMERGIKATNFLKNEEGTDPFSNEKIKVLESKYPREYYYKYLMDLIEESKINNSAYGEVEEIIYIGIYRENKRTIAPYLFKEIVNHIYEKNIIIDYAGLIGLPLKNPIFFKPFGIESIFDIMFGRLKIYLAIDLNKLINLFNSKGISTKWLSKKETHKILDKGRRYKPFTFENRAIEITINEDKVTLGDSFLIYLLFDNLTPSSFVESYKSMK